MWCPWARGRFIPERRHLSGPEKTFHHYPEVGLSHLLDSDSRSRQHSRYFVVTSERAMSDVPRQNLTALPIGGTFVFDPLCGNGGPRGTPLGSSGLLDLCVELARTRAD